MRRSGARAPAVNLPAPPETYDPDYERQRNQALEQAMLALSHAHTIKPAIQAEAVRSGDSAALTITIRDYDRRVTAIEFNKREGTGSETGFVSTWDTSTGTIGTDAELIRTESISIPEGLDSACEWRVKWRDQQGTEHTEGASVPMANLASLTKTIRIPATSFAPVNETTAFAISNGWLYPNSTDVLSDYWTAVVLPKGVTITAFRANLYKETSGTDRAEADLRKVAEDGTAASVTTGVVETSTSGAWDIAEETGLSETVGSDVYVSLITLMSSTTSNLVDGRAMWIEIEYTTPSYDKTY